MVYVHLLIHDNDHEKTFFSIIQVFSSLSICKLILMILFYDSEILSLFLHGGIDEGLIVKAYLASSWSSFVHFIKV